MVNIYSNDTGYILCNYIVALSLEAVTSLDIDTDEESNRLKIKYQRQSCEKFCCPCSGFLCHDLCKSDENACAKVCCAMELRNISEVPKIVNIP